MQEIQKELEAKMIIDTKYSPHDTVWGLDRQVSPKTQICPFCAGKGKIQGANGETWVCPRCIGAGTLTTYPPAKWEPKKLTIGQVAVTVTDSDGKEGETLFDNYKPQKTYAEQYMCVETGIGAGRLWEVELLFTCEEDAQRECEKRNNGGEE